MSDPSPRLIPRIVVLTGPTGVGKTALAVELVERFGGEVVSADSRQVYKYLDIGTAKPILTSSPGSPPPDRLRGPGRAVHGDAVSGRRRHGAGRPGRPRQTAWVVGGSWHYIQALVDRIEPPQVPPNPELRAELEREAAEHGPEALHARLAGLDPVSAALIDRRNVRRWCGRWR